MSILDEADRLKQLDPKSMSRLLETFPAQLQAAFELAKGLTLERPQNLSNLLLTGLGGSAIGGDVVRSVLGGALELPFFVNRDYTLPAYVTSSTLVFACSYSGNTEETLSAYRQARQTGAHVVCITSGGELCRLGRAEGVPVIEIPGGLPPRAALGYSVVALLGALRALGLADFLQQDIQETIGELAALSARYGVANPEPENPAKLIAASLRGKIVAVYGSAGLLDSAAARWRGQIEENAKNLAFHHVLPEMNHNELVGWSHPKNVLRNLGVVFLRDRGDHAQVQRRFDLTVEIVRRHAGVVHECWTEGHCLLTRLFSIIYLGDFVSLYLAYLNRVDPTPVDVIESLKTKLKQ